MQAQMKAIKGEVLATEASKRMTRGRVAKASQQDVKSSGERPHQLKSKPAASHSKDGQSAVADFPLDDLKSAFEAMLDPDGSEHGQSQ